MSDNDKKIGLGAQLLMDKEWRQEHEEVQEALKAYIERLLISDDPWDRLILIEEFTSRTYQNPLTQAISDLLKPILEIKFTEEYDNEECKERKLGKKNTRAGEVAKALGLNCWKSSKLIKPLSHRAAVLTELLIRQDNYRIEEARNKIIEDLQVNYPDLTEDILAKAHQKLSFGTKGERAKE